MEFKNALITGGCGFLGQWLTKYLLESHPDIKIKILDLRQNAVPILDFSKDRRVNYVLGKDILSQKSIESEFRGIDVVFHLAGIIAFGIRDKEKLFKVNIEGTKNVLKAAYKNKVKLCVHISSVAALGYANRKDLLVDENFTFDWSIAWKHHKYYMLSKHLADLEADKLIIKGLRYVRVYPGLLYGPGDHTNSAKGIKVIAGHGAPVSPPGGTNVIDVRDVAKGIILAAEKGKPGRSYLLSGHNLRFSDISRIIAKQLKKKYSDKTIPTWMAKPSYYFALSTEKMMKKPLLTADMAHSGFKIRYFDNSRAGKELGWKPRISFEKTIKDTIIWMRKNGLFEK